MYIADYHCHTNISPDSQVSMEDQCKAAIAAGLNEVAFTDHLECGEECMGWQNGKRPYDPKRYNEEIKRCRELFGNKLIIRSGAEVGQWLQDVPRVEWLFSEVPMDFVLCSLHCPIDYTDMYWFDYERADVNEMLTAYVKECAEMAAQNLDFDSFGHLTLPFRYASKTRRDLSYEHCQKELDEFLRALAEFDKALEVNTSGLRGDLGLTLPDLGILKRFKELGGRHITIGSDTHRTEHMGAHIVEAQALVYSAGFEGFVTFDNRKRIFHQI